MLDPLVVKEAAEPAYCPKCGLKHTRRQDWLCPRCRTPVETELPATVVARSARSAEAGFPAGARIAGAAMIAAGIAVGAVLARNPAAGQRWAMLAVAVLLAALGVGALLEAAWARWTALGAAVVAALLAAEDAVRERLPGLAGDPVPPAIRAWPRATLHPLHPWPIFLVLAFAVGTTVLLVGRPRRVRMAAGIALAAPLLVLLAIRAIRG